MYIAQRMSFLSYLCDWFPKWFKAWCARMILSNLKGTQNRRAALIEIRKGIDPRWGYTEGFAAHLDCQIEELSILEKTLKARVKT